MIQIATSQLKIAEDDGTPAVLDIGLLEKNLGDAFRKLGYNDVWMAEDISLTITERIHDSDATLISQSQIDSMVNTILNALGYPDVAMEYSRAKGATPLEGMRQVMHDWSKDEIVDTLGKALPLTGKQVENVSGLCLKAMEKLGLKLASKNLIIELATNILANENNQEEIPQSKNKLYSYWRLEGISEHSVGLMANGILHPNPPSQFISRARLVLNFEQFTKMNPDWWMPISLTVALENIIPSITEILTAMQKELSARHPIQKDSPSHIIIQDCEKCLGKEPNLWRKQDRNKLSSIIQHTLFEKIQIRNLNITLK